MGFFDINSPFMRSMAKVADIIILNFLFMLCCIPVITIGPALTALYSVTMKLVRDEESGIVKEFFSSFRLNLKQGILIHIMFLVITFVLFVDIWFVLYSVEDHGAMTYILFAVAAFAAVMAAMTLLYVYPVLAKFDNSTGKTLQIALSLAIRHLPTTCILAVITAIPVAAVMIPNEAIISALFLMLICGFSALAFAQSFFLRKVFDRYIPQPNHENAMDEVHK